MESIFNRNGTLQNIAPQMEASQAGGKMAATLMETLFEAVLGFLGL